MTEVIAVFQSLEFWFGVAFALAAEELAHKGLRARAGNLVKMRDDPSEAGNVDEPDRN